MSRLTSHMHEFLTKDVLKTLFDRNIYTIIEFVQTDPKKLTDISMLKFKEILTVRNHLLDTYGPKINCGSEYLNHLRHTSSLIPTGIKSLDDLLDGGFRSSNIIEVCGNSGAGKTQLCTTIAVNVAQNLDKSVYFIDSKYDCKGKRVCNILKTRGIDNEQCAKILEKIKVVRVSNQYEAFSVMYKIKNLLDSNPNVKLIIIDSLPAIFYQIGNITDNFGLINHFTNLLRFISTELNICVLVVNIMLKYYDMNPSDSVSKPGLGKYWESVPNLRLLMSSDAESTSISLIKSNDIPVKSCNIEITNEGVI